MEYTCQRRGEHKVHDWLKSIQQQLYPDRCVLCGQPGAHGLELCPGCHQDLPWLDGGCVRCGVPLPEIHGAVCGACLSHPPAFNCVQAPFTYRSPIAQWVVTFKYHRKLQYGRLLGELLVRELEIRLDPLDLPQCLIPVPLFRWRQWRRGFNQAHELARMVGGRLGLPVETHWLRRKRATLTQMGLSAHQRRSNLRHAFQITRSPDYTHVAVVDDVITTGSTADAVARCLRRAGVPRVDVWCVARAEAAR